MKGKNLTKILMSILLVLLSIAVIIIAFVGIYVPKSNKLKNIIPDYKLGTEANGIIEYRLVPDDSEEEIEVWVDSKGNIKGYVEDGSEHTHDESVEVTSDLEENTTTTDTGFNEEVRTIKKNEESSLTKENFEKSKKLIENRLEKFGATEYNIRLDEKTGNMVIELSQNDNIPYLSQVALLSAGDFDIIDYQTGVILMDKSHLKDATVVSNVGDNNKYNLYLQLTFDDSGKEILKEIVKQYISYTNESGEEVQERVSFRVDGSSLMTTYFPDDFENFDQNILNIPYVSDIEVEDVNDYAESLDNIAYLLNHDTLPVKYVVGNSNGLFIESNLSDNTMTIVTLVIVSILGITTLLLLIKFGARGFLAGIMNACLIGLVILVLKYVKVVISISSIVALFAVIALNIIFIISYLRRKNENEQGAYLETLKRYYAITFPLVVMSFIFTFFVSASISGLGSVLFWGMLLQIIYNTIILKYVI